MKTENILQAVKAVDDFTILGVVDLLNAREKAVDDLMKEAKENEC